MITKAIWSMGILAFWWFAGACRIFLGEGYVGCEEMRKEKEEEEKSAYE